MFEEQKEGECNGPKGNEVPKAGRLEHTFSVGAIMPPQEVKVVLGGKNV